jgi:hypothetical protein
MPVNEILVDYYAWLGKPCDKLPHSREYAVAKLIRHGVGAPIDLEQEGNTRVVVVKKNAVDCCSLILVVYG